MTYRSPPEQTCSCSMWYIEVYRGYMCIQLTPLCLKELDKWAKGPHIITEGYPRLSMLCMRARRQAILTRWSSYPHLCKHQHVVPVITAGFEIKHKYNHAWKIMPLYRNSRDSTDATELDGNIIQCNVERQDERDTVTKLETRVHTYSSESYVRRSWEDILHRHITTRPHSYNICTPGR